MIKDYRLIYEKKLKEYTLELDRWKTKHNDMLYGEGYTQAEIDQAWQRVAYYSKKHFDSMVNVRRENEKWDKINQKN